MLTFWRHLYRQSVKTFYSNKITHVRCSNRIFAEISISNRHGEGKIFVKHPRRTVWMCEIMSVPNLSSSGCTESNTDCIHVDVRKSGVLENQENDDRLRLDMTEEALEIRSPELKVCDAVNFQLESESPAEGSASHSSQSHSNIFDMSQVVERVKIRVRKSRENKKVQEKISVASQFENDSFNLSSLFDESNLSCEGQRKEKKGKSQMSKSSSITNQSDSDSFGLQSLFEGNKIDNKAKERTRTNRLKKRKKHAANEKINDKSFGLELLFDENKGKRKRRRKILEDSEEDNESGTEKHVVKRKKPNYFVAIRVSNPQIHVAVKDFQDSILEENEKLKPALIPLPSLHLTMGVMHLDGALREIAKGALDKCKTSINDILKGVNFKVGFLGVGNFRDEVVFAKVQEEKQVECLKTVNDVITAVFQEEGICMDEGKEWKPHLTLLKLSRKSALRKRGIKKIKEDIYSSWTDSYFGEEQVESVHLCSMFEPKEKDGFYKCVATVSFDMGNEETRKPLEDLSCTKLECEEENTSEQ